MSRYGTAVKSAGQSIREGDDSFIGMNMELDRSTLAQGYYALAINKRVNDGIAAKRGGTITPGFANLYAPRVLYGSGLYSNPNGVEVILEAITHTMIDMSIEHSVQMIRCGAYPTTVAVPAGAFNNVDRVEFSQDFDKVQLHRSNANGDLFPRLAWDGVNPTGFTVVVMTTPLDTSKALIPGVAWSVNMSDRDVFPISNDTFGVSLLADYSMWDPIFGAYRVSSASAAPLVGLFPFGQGQLVIGKQRSIYRAINFSGDLSTAAIEVVTNEVGVWARLSFKMIGSDAIFLSRTGFYRMSQTDQTLLQTSPVPVGAHQDALGRVTDPIAPLIARINWAYADKAVSAVLSPYYFCAVPIDGSTVNNAVLVYNTISDSWDAYDTWDAGSGFQIDNLIVTDYQGTPHVYCVNNNAFTRGIHVLYLDTAEWDTTAVGQFEITDLFETRGYATLVFITESNEYGATTRREIQRADIALRTWRPNFTVTQLSESAFDERVLASNITKDRTKVLTWGKPNYDPSNVTDQAMQPGREDYSVALPVYPKSGIVLQKRQEDVLRLSIHGRARWVSYRIQSNQGRCDVAGVLLESKPIQRNLRRAS